MKDAQKPDHISLNTLINRLREGRYMIPDFQREFEWNPWDIRDLIRSVFLDYYIGSLLLWKGKQQNFDALSCESIYGFNGDGENPEYIVLDGQQRLTALFYACLSPDVSLPNRANRAYYFIHVDRFMAEDFDEAFNYMWDSKRWRGVVANPQSQYERHLFPLSVVGAGGWDLFNWVQGYEQFWRSRATEAETFEDNVQAQKAGLHADEARGFGDHVKDITEQYQISYIELDQDIAVDKVCDIFTQINSRGVRLDAFDLINALVKPKGIQLKQMWREAAPRLEFVETQRMNVYILQVMSILRQAYCSPKYLYFLLPGQEKPIRASDGTRQKEILISDAKEFEYLWHEAVDALESAIKQLQHPHEFGAISSNYLPYVSILPVFSALQKHVESILPSQKLNAQRKIHHWYWASVFTNRYSGSVESTSARDFLTVREWVNDDQAEPALLTEFRNRFRDLDLRGETRSGTSIYSGIFNLLVIQGARDWMTGSVPQHGDLDDHHIVPSSWGANNLPGDLVHTILNRSPLTAETNRKVIKNRLPNEYLPELVMDSGEATVRTILESHFISPAAQQILLRKPFTTNDFEAFISERQRTLTEAIESLLIKERLDLSPRVRELDEKIEKVELGLRWVISEALKGDASQIPSHITNKLEERIQRTVRKNAALDADAYDELDGMLEFFDLRELQVTISNKTLWPQFENRFRSRGTLDNRFDQLAELRNGIRHSRTVDEVTRMEGAASILWFEQVLTK